MRVPALLLLVCLAGIAAALLVPGWHDLVLLAGTGALGSLYLLLGEVRRRSRHRLGRAREPIVVDGSNVMYWDGETPKIETVRLVIGHLTALGYQPGVMFDANAGYLLSGRYRHDDYLGRELGLPRDRVMVVPKGTPADSFILLAARDLGARIVTNDRYRDWADDYPEIREPGRLIRGDLRSGNLWLDLEPQETPLPAATTPA